MICCDNLKTLSEEERVYLLSNYKGYIDHSISKKYIDNLLLNEKCKMCKSKGVK